MIEIKSEACLVGTVPPRGSVVGPEHVYDGYRHEFNFVVGGETVDSFVMHSKDESPQLKEPDKLLVALIDRTLRGDIKVPYAWGRHEEDSSMYKWNYHGLSVLVGVKDGQSVAAIIRDMDKSTIAVADNGVAKVLYNAVQGHMGHQHDQLVDNALSWLSMEGWDAY